jgi:hypothetical protein
MHGFWGNADVTADAVMSGAVAGAAVIADGVATGSRRTDAGVSGRGKARASISSTSRLLLPDASATSDA